MVVRGFPNIDAPIFMYLLFAPFAPKIHTENNGGFFLSVAYFSPRRFWT